MPRTSGRTQGIPKSTRPWGEKSGHSPPRLLTLKIHHELTRQPIATAGSLVERVGLTAATVNRFLAHLAGLGIVKELTQQKRNRIFSYTGYIEILSQGLETEFA